MGRHIVVIEDEPAVYNVLAEALGEEGFIVSHLIDGRAAQDLDPRLDPELILMDLMLPGLDGIKLTSHLRAHGFAHTPIVALSASAIKLYCARESGLFQACLAKPFDLSELLECAERLAGIYVTLSPLIVPRSTQTIGLLLRCRYVLPHDSAQPREPRRRNSRQQTPAAGRVHLARPGSAGCSSRRRSRA